MTVSRSVDDYLGRGVWTPIGIDGGKHIVGIAVSQAVLCLCFVTDPER